MAAKAFVRVRTIDTSAFPPEEAKRLHIEYARKELGKVLGPQGGGAPGYLIETDHNPAKSEEQVKPYGLIVYRFTRLAEIAAYALEKAREFSPVMEDKKRDRNKHAVAGRYKNSWFFLVDNVGVELENLPVDKPFHLTNNQPYHRKIHVQAKGFGPPKYTPPGIVEKVRQVVLQKYGNLVEANIDFLQLAGGYELKHSLQYVDKHGNRYGTRHDAHAGSEITYPALLITPKRYS